MKIKFVAYMALALASATASHAAVIYDSGKPRVDRPLGLGSDDDGNILVADDFLLSSGATTFNRITWWGVYSPIDLSGDPSFIDDFTISIHESTANVPATDALVTYDLGAVTRVKSTLPSGNPYYMYVADISSTSLLANTTYYLSIWNNTPGTDENWAWFRATDGSGPETTFHRNNVGDNWSPRSAEQLSYNLSNEPAPPVVPVPAPAMLGLLGIGLVGAARRFRGRAA